jgi:hypothetical protein
LRESIKDEYFEWLFDLVCGEKFGRGISYRRLLATLHDIPFRYSIPRDENRAEDGIDLRRRFALLFERYRYNDIMDVLESPPCSVLEMMTALAIRCEETLMDDPRIGDRTRQWFWNMVNNLGLGAMRDDRFDKNLVEENIDRFLSRDYEPNGEGGLFTIKRCKADLRTVEIWYQLCWYLDTIT